MKKIVKLPIADLLQIDFESDWSVSPTLAVRLDQRSFTDVVLTEDGLFGEISYDVFDLVEHTYTYIDPADGQVKTHTQSAGTFGRPSFYDAQTMTEVSQEDVDAIISAYDDYAIGVSYSAGDKFKYEGNAYSVIQGHISQPEWKPDSVPALYKRIVPEELIGDWVQPTGAHDAYNTGDKVIFEGSIYESLIDANVWSPTAYPAGWSLV